jgi:hypothetical protein
MNEDDFETLLKLQKIANKHFNGHLIILKFTTNWRIGNYSSFDREDISKLASGETFDEAAIKYLENLDPKQKEI